MRCANIDKFGVQAQPPTNGALIITVFEGLVGSILAVYCGTYPPLSAGAPDTLTVQQKRTSGVLGDQHLDAQSVRTATNRKATAQRLPVAKIRKACPAARPLARCWIADRTLGTRSRCKRSFQARTTLRDLSSRPVRATRASTTISTVFRSSTLRPSERARNCTSDSLGIRSDQKPAKATLRSVLVMNHLADLVQIRCQVGNPAEIRPCFGPVRSGLARR